MSQFRRSIRLLTLGVASLLGSPLGAQAVRNTSYVLASGERILRHEGELAAPIVSMVGWPASPAADSVYSFFDRDNAYTMRQLQQRFAKGRP